MDKVIEYYAEAKEICAKGIKKIVEKEH